LHDPVSPFWNIIEFWAGESALVSAASAGRSLGVSPASLLCSTYFSGGINSNRSYMSAKEVEPLVYGFRSHTSAHHDQPPGVSP